MKIIIYHLMAFGVGMYLGSLIKTDESLVWMLAGGNVLVVCLFVRWLEARGRYEQAMKKRRSDRQQGL